MEFEKQFDEKFDNYFPNEGELFHEVREIVKDFFITQISQAIESERGRVTDRLSEIHSSCHSWAEYERKIKVLINELSNDEMLNHKTSKC